MSLTKRQLDTLCGGPPTEVRDCVFSGCDRLVGPYYEAREAREAIREHVRWVHGIVPASSVDGGSR